MVDAGTAVSIRWYATLNNGLRVTAVGGEDSISSMHNSKLVGSTRTYVYTADRGLDADAWFAGLRKGQRVRIDGPLVELTVDGRIPGEEVELPAGGGEVTVVARVQSITPLQSVTLVWNGEVIEKIPLSADRKSAQLTKRLKVVRSGWYHLRAEGKSGRALSARHVLRTGLHQSGVGDGRQVSQCAAPQPRPTACRWIDQLQQMAEAWPGWRSQKEKDHVYAQFDEARAVYRKLLAEATATSSP